MCTKHTNDIFNGVEVQRKSACEIPGMIVSNCASQSMSFFFVIVDKFHQENKMMKGPIVDSVSCLSLFQASWKATF